MSKWIYSLSCVAYLTGALLINSHADATEQQEANTQVWYDLEWIAEQRQDHPLVGRLWDVAGEQFIDWEQLRQQLPRSGWILLGEQHDHPDHHQLQRWFIERLASGDNLGNVAMEMISSDQQEAIDEWQGDLDNLTPDELNWPERGWPWQHYASQVTSALRYAERLVAGDLSTDEKSKARENLDKIERYSDSHNAFLADLVVTSHCNLFPADRADPMVAMQIARDQYMAEQLARFSVAQKVSVFIAGSGHVRADYGVPKWLPDELPRITIILQAVGVNDDPSSYLADRHNDEQPADLILFVPALPERDYCAELLEQMQR